MTPPPLRRRMPGPPPPQPPSVWTPEKEKAVLDAFRSFVGNSAKKYQLPPSEVISLVKDHILDPGD